MQQQQQPPTSVGKVSVLFLNKHLNKTYTSISCCGIDAVVAHRQGVMATAALMSELIPG